MAFYSPAALFQQLLHLKGLSVAPRAQRSTHPGSHRLPSQEQSSAGTEGGPPSRGPGKEESARQVWQAQDIQLLQQLEVKQWQRGGDSRFPHSHQLSWILGF